VLDGRVLPGLGEGSVVPDVTWASAAFLKTMKDSLPWWGKQFRTYRSLPFLMSSYVSRLSSWLTRETYPA
jgi:hypothetical protein